MKTTAKIFWLTLIIFAFLCSFLITSAAVEGEEDIEEPERAEKIVSEHKFEEVDLGPLYQRKDGLIIDENGNTGVMRMGEFEIRASDNGNRYVTARFAAEKQGNSGAYIDISYGNSASAARDSEGKYYLKAPHMPLDTIKYYLLDFDIMTPTGEHMQGLNFAPYFYSYKLNENKIGSYYFSSPSSSSVKITNVGEDTYNISSNTGISAEFHAYQGAWTHVSYLIEMDLSSSTMEDGTISNYNITKSKVHIFIDGNLMFTINNAFSSNSDFDSVFAYHEGSLGYATMREFRINFPMTLRTSENENNMTAIDNVRLTVFDTEYEGSYTDVAASVYNESYEKPDVNGVIAVDDIRYGGFKEALLNIKDGSVVTLMQDFPGVHIPTAAHKIVKGEFKFEYDAGNYYIDEIDEEGNVIFREPTEDEKFTVNWYGINGELIHTDEDVVINKTVTPPKTPSIRDSGWYDADYEWGFSDFTYAESFVITKDTDFYPVLTTIRPYTSAFLYTIRPLGNIQMLLYVPTEEFRITGISELSLSDGTAAMTPIESGVSIDDKKYDVYDVGDILAADIGTKFNAVTLKFSAELPTGEKREIETVLELSVADYLEAILTSYSYASAQNSAADIIRYAAAHSNLKYGELDDALIYLTSNFSSVSTKSETVTLPASSADYSAIKQYIKYVGISFESDEVGYHLVIKDGTRVKNISFAIEGLEDPYAEKCEKGVCYYGIGDNVKYFDGTQFIKEATSHRIPIYLFGKTVSIILTLEDGSVARGNYDMTQYYSTIKNGSLKSDGISKYTEDEVALYKDLMIAMRAYYISADKYRYNNSAPLPDKAKEYEILYEDYGAVGDGVTDDFAAIKAAHDFANTLVNDGYINVVVRADEDAIYYIGAGNVTKESECIVISTNTELEGATFIIDDSLIGTNSQEGKYPVFKVASAYQHKTLNIRSEGGAGETISAINSSGGLSETTEKIDLGLGYSALLVINGVNAGENVKIGVVVDSHGNIDKDTPITTPVNAISNIVAHRCDERRITISNAVFITKFNYSAEADSVYFRGIEISRSNVTLQNITHHAPDEVKKATPYSAFISVVNANAVSIVSSAFSKSEAYLNSSVDGYEITSELSHNFLVEDIVLSVYVAPDIPEVPEEDEE